MLAPAAWPFAQDWAERIDRHWAQAQARQPALFDGRVLMMTQGAVDTDPDGTRAFRAAYAPVSFRAFLAWRDFGHPVRGFRNGFAMAALRSADGAYLLGEMGAHTANAGRIYFPSGTPDLSDVAEGRVDLAGSVRRELAEETGLDPAGLAFAPGFTVIHDDLRVCVMQAVTAPEPAEVLQARIHAGLARQAEPELACMHVLRGPADITPAVPPFVAVYLRRAFAAGSSAQSG